jgi:hypothetical protein
MKDIGDTPVTGDACRDVVEHLARCVRHNHKLAYIVGPGSDLYWRLVTALVSLGATEDAAHARLRCVDRLPPGCTEVSFSVWMGGEETRAAIDELVSVVDCDDAADDAARALVHALDDARLVEGA